MYLPFMFLRCFYLTVRTGVCYHPTIPAAFKAPSGLSNFAVSAPGLSGGYQGVSVGSITYCNGAWATDGISGGSSVSLSAEAISR